MAYSRTTISDSQRPPRTACKICECSVFRGDDTAWVVSPNPGIAHRLCAEEAAWGPPQKP